MEETAKTRSFRITDRTQEMFKQVAEEQGMNQNDTMQLLISAYELHHAKEMIPDARKDIEDFASHLTCLQNAFTHLLEVNENAEIRVQEQYKTRLQNMEKLIETERKEKRKIEDDFNIIQEKEEKQSKVNEALQQKIETLMQDIHTKDTILTGKQETIDGLYARLSDMEELKEKNSILEATLQETNKKLSEIIQKNTDLTAEFQKLQTQIRTQEDALNIQKTREKENLEIQKREYERKLQSEREYAEIKRKQDVMDARQEERDREYAIREKLQNKIEKLQQQIIKAK